MESNQYSHNNQLSRKSTEPQKFFIAIDHGLSFPEMQGLEHPFDILKMVSDNKAIDGVIASLGIYRQAQKLKIDLEDKTRLLLVDYATVEEQANRAVLTQRKMIVKPEETQIVNPQCFKMFLNVYEDSKELYQNCRDLERFAVYGAQHDIATLAEIMFYGNRAFENPHTQASELIRGCRIAMELGADALKIPYMSDLSVVNQIADTLKLPIYLLGGNKKDNITEFLAQLKLMRACKVDGFMFGRNVWQSEDMAQTIEDILYILHGSQN